MFLGCLESVPEEYTVRSWPTPAKILFWFGAVILTFFVLRLILPESLLFLAAIPGAVFVGYMANLGVQQVRNPPARRADPKKPEG